VKTVTVYLGLGSNLGDRYTNLRRSLKLLSTNVEIEQVSSVYDTAPVGNANQPRFLNLVCKVKTALSPTDLLTFVKGIEERMGRITGPRNSPRPIDIDILFYDKLVLETPVLVIPHPYLAERAFVLVPLADITSSLKHPVNGKKVSQMLQELERTPGDLVITKYKIQ
jgi:2-amino-4-hydroxy-6-hydroxymethyldihydropteridine diphosphokinase